MNKATILIAAVLVCLPCSAWAAEDIIITPDNGATDSPIQAAISAAIKAGGGRILIKAGTYEIRRGLNLANAKDVSLIGEKGARLVMAPEVCAIVAADAPAGQNLVEVESSAGIAEGMSFEVQAPGRTEIVPNGQKYHVQYFGLAVASVAGNQIKTTRPLQYAAPKGTKLLHAYNVFQVGGRSSNVLIQGLEIDLNRDRWPVRPINHTSHCGVLGSGSHDSKKPESRPATQRVVIRDCVIRNAHHRGIAWYGVADSSVIGCRIENTGAEAIDLDHFCFNCEARDNDLRNAPSGVELNDASDCIVENNRIDGCERGIILWRWFKDAHLDVGNIFRANQITNSKKAAITCEPKTSKTLIAGNTIQGSAGKGIHIGGDDNTIERNTVSSCAQEAILITGSRNTLRGNDCKDSKELIKNNGKENQTE